jgi:hypothetical protein
VRRVLGVPVLGRVIEKLQPFGVDGLHHGVLKRMLMQHPKAGIAQTLAKRLWCARAGEVNSGQLHGVPLTEQPVTHQGGLKQRQASRCIYLHADTGLRLVCVPARLRVVQVSAAVEYGLSLRQAISRHAHTAVLHGKQLRAHRQANANASYVK